MVRPMIPLYPPGFRKALLSNFHHPMDLREQARKAVERNDEIEHMLQSPEVLSDMGRVADLSKQHKGMQELVGKSREFLSLQSEFEEWRLAARDSGDAELQKLAQDEVKRLEVTLPELEQDLKRLLIPRDPADDRGAIMEIRAGTGGDEASLFAGDLFRMYQHYVESRGWHLHMVSCSEGTVGGFKEIVAEVSAEGS